MTEQNSLALPGALLLTSATVGGLMFVAVPRGFAEAASSGDHESANGWAGIALWFNDGGAAPALVGTCVLFLVLLLCWAAWRGMEHALAQ